jgi:Rhomboid family
LYITTYLYSIIAGNVMDMMINLKAQQTYCLGASGGICGLYGLMFVCLVRMGNTSAASRIARGMVIILLYGVIFANISNASHVGGFLMGLVIGILSGPSYTKDYSMIRKNSLQVDVLDKDYRQVIGYDKKPSKHGLVPIQLVWIASIMFLLVQVGSLSSSSSFYRSIPASILRGFAK